MSSHDSSSANLDPVVAAFARWRCGLVWSALPEATRRMAVDELLDFVGDAVAGRAAVGMPAWLDVLLVEPRAHSATVVGGTIAIPWAAALANGYFGHVLELDDTHDIAVLHAGASAIPAALAAAEQRGGVTGARLLEAIVAGIELNCRLGVATDLSLVEGGWIYSSLLGHFGAALAAAHVLELDEAATRNALGIAYCHTCGNHQSSREGAPTKHVQPGIAAENGLKSALMAARGLRGVDLPFTGEDGFARVYLHGRFDAQRAFEGLGADFETARLSFKPYPSCRLTHPAVSAALELRAKLGADLDRVQSIRIGMGRQAHDVVGRAVDFRLAPRRWLDAQFSVFWTVASALCFGAVTPKHLLAEVPPSAALEAWIGRITAEPLAGSAMRDVGACEIEARGPFGTVAVSAAQAKGHPDNPLTTAEVFAKFAGNVELAGVGSGEARSIADGILALATSPNVNPVVRAFARPIPRAARRASTVH
jgi:2-methylcitrate dehydratase PrpD